MQRCSCACQFVDGSCWADCSVGTAAEAAAGTDQPHCLDLGQRRRCHMAERKAKGGQ